jgi:hypothetical protein
MVDAGVQRNGRILSYCCGNEIITGREMRSKAGNGGYAKRVPVATRGTDAMRRRWEGMRGKRVA